MKKASSKFLVAFLACVLIFVSPKSACCEDTQRQGRSISQQANPLTPGDHLRTLIVEDLKRTAVVHIPLNHNPKIPTPLVIAIHGAAMNASIMASFCGLNETADLNTFVVVYPNGTGPAPLLTWNAGGFKKGFGSQVDDVMFFKKLLDDLDTVLNIDPKRIYACGMSNGGMMCYRLAAEMSDRIAAIAPVAGTMANYEVHPQRPVSVIHFHGTKDHLVPYETESGSQPFWLNLKSVESTIQTWRKLDGCHEQHEVKDRLSQDGDELQVTRKSYGPGDQGTEVVLITVEGGGHAWPGQEVPYQFLGKSAMNVSANNLIWEFFTKHPMGQ